MQRENSVRKGETYNSSLKQVCRVSARRVLLLLTIGVLSLPLLLSEAVFAGSVVAWGYNRQGQCDIPQPNNGFSNIAAGCYHSLGIKNNRTIEIWGRNDNGQCVVPSPNSDFIAIDAGVAHSMGLKDDHSIRTWGLNDEGQCDIPIPNANFISVAGGGYGGYVSLGLKADGSIMAWGRAEHGQLNVPAPNTEFVAMAAGESHCLGLKEDGSIVAWGSNAYGQCNVPQPNSGFRAIAAGGHFSLGLKEEDGSVVAWGRNDRGQLMIPMPNIAYEAISAGYEHALSLRTGGSLEAWGRNDYGQGEVPFSLQNTRFTKIAAGGFFNLAIEETTSTGGTIRGTVTDAVTQGPLAGVVVEAYGEKDSSDEYGCYELSSDLIVGNVVVLANKEFYGANTQEVFVASGQTVEAIDFALADERDPDRDRLDNSHEAKLNTEPGDPDTDNDGVMDGYEFANGTDPLDRASWFSNGLVIFGSKAGIWNANSVVNQDSIDLLKQVYTDLDGKLNCVKFWLTWNEIEKTAVSLEAPVGRDSITEEMIDEYAFPEEDHSDYDFKGKVVWDYYDWFLDQLQNDESHLHLAALPWIGEGWAAPARSDSDLRPLNPDTDPEDYLARLKLHVRGAVRRYGRPQQRNGFKGKDLIHFWNMENELNWTFLWRTYTAPAEEAQSCWTDESFVADVIKTIADAIAAEDPCAIRTHNFNSFLLFDHRGIETFLKGVDAVAKVLGLSQILDYDFGSKAPLWSVGLQPVQKWKDHMEVIGIGSYPNYLFGDPVLGFTVPPYISLVVQNTGKPAMVVESGYPTGPVGFTWSELGQVAYIQQAIPGTRLVSDWAISNPDSSLPAEAQPIKSGLGFVYFVLNTGEELGGHKFPVEDYWGFLDVLQNYKLGFYAYREAISESGLTDSTRQLVATGWTPVYSVLRHLTPGGTATIDVPLKIGRGVLKLIVNWRGSTLGVRLYSPDGSLYGYWESSEPPIHVDLGSAPVGDWRLEVVAVDVPYDNYPFLVLLETPSVLPIGLDVDPDNLNLKAKGKWLTCHVTLDGIFALAEDDPGWAILSPQGDSMIQAHVERWSVDIENSDEDTTALILKFDADTVRSWYAEDDSQANLRLQGGLSDGTSFGATAVIGILCSGSDSIGEKRPKGGHGKRDVGSQ